MKKVISFISVFVACFAFLFVITSCDNSNSNTDNDKQQTVTPVNPESPDETKPSNPDVSSETKPSNPDVPVNPGTDEDVYYTITFKDYDGTILQSSSVKKGETPTFNKSNPTRISNDNYSYEFRGWNPAITVATKDAEYIATYNEFINEYIITWKNYDGEVLEVDQNVPYGTVPEYNGVKPQKSNTEEFAYSFIGWDKEITSVTGDTTYIAEYEVYSLNLNYTLNESKNGYIVSGNSVSTAEIIIPSYYNDLPVTSVGKDAFYNCTSLTSITIPDSVTSIGQKAFSYCSSLTSITIPDSVTSIGSDAFRSCYRLVEVINKSSLSITLDSTDNGYIGYYAKQIITDESDSKLSTDENGFITYNDGTDIWLVNYIGNSTEIVIPNNVTKINDYSFYNWTSLISITIPDSITSIGSSAFRNCSSLTNVYYDGAIEDWCNITFSDSDSNPMYYATNFYILDENGTIENNGKNYKLLIELEIPSTVTSIGKFQFYNCSSLTSVVIGDSVTSIGGSAFFDCSSLTSITIPDSVTSIGDNAFEFCSSLTSIIIPDSVTSIGEYAFHDCSSLTSVVIGDSVTSIGGSAFSYCTSLTSVVIGDSVTSIGGSAFSVCYRLVEVINKSSLSITLGSSSNGYIGYYAKQIVTDESDSKLSTDENGFITCNDGTDIWLVNYIGNSTEIVIPNNVTKINDYAFYNCRLLASITIPDSVTSIGSYAFYGCSLLTSVTIPDSVTSIRSRAFYNCSSLTSITIPDSVTSIGSYAFYKCTSLTSVVIGDSVTSIGSWAFYNCSSVTKVYYKGISSYTDTITSIENNNQSLTSATWYYFTSNGANETASGNWWYYDTDGITIIEKVIS